MGKLQGIIVDIEGARALADFEVIEIENENLSKLFNLGKLVDR